MDTCRDVGKMQAKKPDEYFSIDGNSLTTADLVCLGKGFCKIKLSPEAEERVIRAENVIEKILSENQVVYGVNTGFGKFAQTVVRKDQLKELQENLVRSTSAGVGPPLSPERTRMLLALRINVLAKGHSGISLETLQKMVLAFNASCLSWVPEQGTVGASGDLAPLAHLALGLMGEGRMWSPQTGWTDAMTVLEGHGLTPISLKPKEGISLINGTQMISSLGAEAVERAEAISRQADVIASLTVEMLKGTNKAFDMDVHVVRPHPGQILVAQRFRSLLHSDFFPSEIADEKSYKGVQDAYTLRCCPQVHGITNDTISFVKCILNTELNSATDNPLVFPERGITISAGNFHGEYPAKALDFLAIGVHELGSISERRIERLCNPSLSNLPAFLVKDGGLNTGFMMAHCTAAALVSENKVLCHPASVDSLSTSAATEDHVSMGGWAARKALKVVEHVEQVLAIELLTACQALEFHRPLKTTAPLEKVYELLRSVVRPWDKDRVMSSDIEEAHKLVLEEKALDFLAIGVHELGSISERRIERLCNPSLSNLPAFLVKDGGLNTGFMMAHCTAAALVSENKVLCHPASVDSLSTSAATEDHVSMGGWAARKALKVVEHVEQVLAIELLTACQALEFHRPLKTTAPLEKVYELLRSVVRPWDKDRVMSSDIEEAHKLVLEEKVWEAVLPYMEQYKKNDHQHLLF
ncbi:histidine ammonia-lyase-like isoform X1 [Tachysurus vachellii]|uniref:histidine ammonia-lyase-like isoform X1 n=1 Tax=Tachysurus vachellii TaxID=175792 RepID=UPI00296AAD22|nr:histidine ammonia-lyase-like isoform X1 [Tachysurus vachellii]